MNNTNASDSAQARPWYLAGLSKEDAKKVELAMKLFTLDESLDKDKISIVAKNESIEWIVEEPNKVKTIASLPSALAKDMPKEIKGFTIEYVVCGRPVNFSYNPNPSDGAYLKIELMPMPEK